MRHYGSTIVRWGTMVFAALSICENKNQHMSMLKQQIEIEIHLSLKKMMCEWIELSCPASVDIKGCRAGHNQSSVPWIGLLWTPRVSYRPASAFGTTDSAHHTARRLHLASRVEAVERPPRPLVTTSWNLRFPQRGPTSTHLIVRSSQLQCAKSTPTLLLHSTKLSAPKMHPSNLRKMKTLW